MPDAPTHPVPLSESLRPLNRSPWRLVALFGLALGVLAFDVGFFTGCGCWYGRWEHMQLDASLIVACIVFGRGLLSWWFRVSNRQWSACLAILVLSPGIVGGAFAVAHVFLPAELKVHAP